MNKNTDPRVVAPEAVVEGVADAGYRPSVPRVRELMAGGRPVLVRCVPPAPGGEGRCSVEREELAETLALISVYAWLGVRVFATDHPRAARQALDMVASIRGTRPPAAVRRGLA
ncbi:hypothetical protein [Allosalinactinospora lopnorensis]|uniref:hypothetical protein n=1 Tax=Allosalinactinospora lopnorensis TaxID=1352348 RepID=UPI000623D183|nr:hypothetical protein [Allosalinactinospora lopnorensis]